MRKEKHIKRGIGRQREREIECVEIKLQVNAEKKTIYRIKTKSGIKKI